MTAVLTRLAAVLVAVGLILGAVALRNGPLAADDQVAGDSDGDGDGDADGTADGLVLCPDDLVELCGAIAAQDGIGIDLAPTAAVAATATDGPLDGPWLVPASWADVVDDARVRGGRQPLARSDVLARSPLVLVGYEQRIEALGRACGIPTGAVTLVCLVDVADQSWASLGESEGWGRVDLGHAAPDTTTGLLATASVAATVAGAEFGRAELREPTNAARFATVEEAVTDFDPGRGGHVAALARTGPSVADLVVVVEADTIGIEDTGQSFGRLVALPTDPLHEVRLVLVAEDPSQLDRPVSLLTDETGAGAFGAAGWRVDGPPTGTPLGELPAAATRPDGPSLTALQSVWAERFG